MRNKQPQPGDRIYLIPIRYWEPDDYAPVAFDVTSHNPANKSCYGFHHGYGREVQCYVTLADDKWAWTREEARRLQMAHAHIFQIVNKDETAKVLDLIHGDQIEGFKIKHEETDDA